MVTITSPDGPPAPAWPWPRNRMDFPSSMPAGTATSSVFPVGKTTRVDPPCAIVARGNRDCDADILPSGGLTARAPAARPEQFGQDVRIDRTAFSGRPAGPEVEAKIPEVAGSAPRLAAKAETLELRRARLAFGVDFAAIEGFALLVVPNNLVSRADFGETLFRFWLLALVGWYSRRASERRI